MKEKLKPFTPLIIGLTLLALSSAQTTVAEPPTDRPNPSGYHRHSGIEGQVFLRFCGLAFPSGELCVDSPYQTSITVYTDSGRPLTSFITDPDGAFSLPLRSGRYVLVPFVASSEGAGGITTILFPIANPVSVEVETHEFSKVSIIYDSVSL